MTKIKIEKAGKKSGDNFTKRVKNIQFIASIKRDGLKYLEKEREPLIYSKNNEKIHIKYPGKETRNGNLWDMRPILYLNKVKSKDLSFGNIWESIDKFIKDSINPKKTSILLARILYKVAFLKCHNLKKLRIKDEEDNNIHDSIKDIYLFDKNKLDKEEQELLEEKILCHSESGDLSISLESFIVYNDFLCTNEDCKYFYRNYYREETAKELKDRKDISDNPKEIKKQKVLKDSKKKPDDILRFNVDKDYDTSTIEWNAETGRINTFLTHINIVYYIYKEKTMYDLLAQSGLKRGVFGIKNSETISKEDKTPSELLTFLNTSIDEEN